MVKLWLQSQLQVSHYKLTHLPSIENGISKRTGLAVWVWAHLDWKRGKPHFSWDFDSAFRLRFKAEWVGILGVSSSQKVPGRLRKILKSRLVKDHQIRTRPPQHTLDQSLSLLGTKRLWVRLAGYMHFGNYHWRSNKMCWGAWGVWGAWCFGGPHLWFL